MWLVKIVLKAPDGGLQTPTFQYPFTYMNTTAQNRDVITAYVDAFNRGDIDGVCRLFSPDAEIFGVLARECSTKRHQFRKSSSVALK
jgi:hypothetical protein